ncbi:interferon-induced protein 44-like [Mercenaria mercenaria]|uniref:interferon-induced protein 44-like n=1 Tax=Mercenaria mercenaria TaxID=6596 RepID=UPI00234EB2D8|nr:interferon-induced protein 44-like [Mercenaria mercenaria]
MGGEDSKPAPPPKPQPTPQPATRVVYRDPPRAKTPPLTSTPWRAMKEKWGPGFSQKLQDETKSISIECGDVKKPGLLLLGPIKAGKSTFINSIFSIGKGRLVNKAYTGSANKSFTVSFTRYRGTGLLKNFRLCDTMGVEDDEEEGFHVSDIVHLIEGHIRDNYKFNPRSALTSKDHAYNPCPKPEEKIHCVVFVIDALVLSSGSISNGMRRKIHHLQEEIRKRDVPRVLVLTKVDLLCQKVAEDIRNIFSSTKVQKAVKKASEIFAIPESNIHPVKNYEGEIEIDPLKNIPLLLALRQIIHFASDYLEENDHDSD